MVTKSSLSLSQSGESLKYRQSITGGLSGTKHSTLVMNLQGSRQRKDMFPVQGDSGKAKGVRDHNNFLSKTRVTADGNRTSVSSSRLKCLQFVRHKETCKETCFSTHGDKRCSVSRFQHPKHFDKATPRKFPDTKVYRSFMEEEETEDVEKSKDSSNLEHTTTENATTRNTNGTAETAHTSRITHQTYAVRRYALFRGMLYQ